MIRLFLFHLIFIFPLYALSQGDCQYDSEGNCIASGKIKSITHKTSYGGKYVTNVRIGMWLLFNADGVKKAQGEYKYQDEFSNKDGEWSFFSDESVLLFKRWFVNGLVHATQFFDSGYYAHDGDTLNILLDSMENMKIDEKKGMVIYSYNSSRGQIVNGDPVKLAKNEKQKAMEQKSTHESDTRILKEFPLIHASLNIQHWAVNSPDNLIQNPDFELTRDQLPENFTSSQIKPFDEPLAKFWGSASETPDLFLFRDNCYAGYRVYGVNYEVLRNELKHPLREGVNYCLQFKLKLKFENSFAINGVSVTLSKNFTGFKIPNDGIKNGVVLQTNKDLPLACREQWMTISGSFTAKGGEQYFYIGNFTPDRDLKLIPIDNVRAEYPDEIYYYIDDVVLIEQKEGTICPCNVDGCELKYDANDTIIKEETILQTDNIYSSPKVGQKLVLRNIQFETNKWELLESSFLTLDSLVDLMGEFPNMKVEISGHTDNRGNEKDNETLSMNRAFAVVTYLLDSGIEKNRITHKGMGQKEPIDTNSTERGRLNNRRVEFKILEL